MIDTWLVKTGLEKGNGKPYYFADFASTGHISESFNYKITTDNKNAWVFYEKEIAEAVGLLIGGGVVCG